ncbi:glycoside hydrolase family 71 protein [Xylona heveae TC161]|uniref:Glycoside hydrolase family 71 protein n=1 Tax=Xylona heveae (strain CBS 132557 / TC161) TaxID=1328760 RepID=A0A165AFG4_XYLHT|nr:glycoside hydrolase family 71 protein [Xylona heveae TC161]KZF20390.1 glycoside hydrolase family 71 protein [Xylona heveae TC161]
MHFAYAFLLLVAVAAGFAQAQSKAVFAHFIIGNSAGMSYDDWVSDVQAAKAAGIDGFALNIAPGDSYTDSSLQNAYNAAGSVGDFSLFLSFDYLSQGAWSASNVVSKINEYKQFSAQFQYNGKPLVSTFEGVGNTGDWYGIKEQTGCFFVPDWSSLGPIGVAAQGSVDGAFGWGAWPVGATDMSVVEDELYMTTLGSKPYMMPVSPWFYTNIPQWNKNWLWRGDDLWHDRWQQVIELQPALVEILTWNDFGESHYIGPIHSSGIPSGAEKYVNDMPHDNWRDMLPYYIAAYKSGNTTLPEISTEKANLWYRVNPGHSGSSDGTTGNTPSQGQTVVDPTLVSQDKVFLSVLVNSPADVTLQIGDNQPTYLRAMTSGVNHFSVSFNGQTGAVTASVSRNGQSVASVTGPEITDACEDGNVNWNAWVGGSS